MTESVATQTEYIRPATAGTSTPQRGVILSHCKLYEVPSSHSSQTPLDFAIIRMADGTQLLTQLTDLNESQPIAIGDEVEMVTRILTTEGQQGVIVYGYKFRPAHEGLNKSKS